MSKELRGSFGSWLGVPGKDTNERGLALVEALKGCTSTRIESNLVSTTRLESAGVPDTPKMRVRGGCGPTGRVLPTLPVRSLNFLLVTFPVFILRIITTEDSGRKPMKDSPLTPLNRRITAHAVRTATNLNEYENLSLPIKVVNCLRPWHNVGGSELVW